MATLADSLISSSARALPIRMRPDLKALQQRYQGQLYWVIKEPVGLQYFRFQEEEYGILQLLDGKTSLDEIKIEFERRFPPQKITVEELGRFVGMLHKSGLVIANVAGQGEQLYKRRTQKFWKQVAAGFASMLCLRFKGIDPDRLLSWLYPKVRIFYMLPGRIVWWTLVLSALALVLVQFDTFRAKLPTFHEFFEAKNWIYLTLTLAITKIIHEFGHGLTCKHFGGECHEMGMMMLVLTPCLYCNVSDSWMLPNKWHRIWIATAGMYIEIFMASIATFLWWFSQPGLLHSVSLSVMFICSISTVMFNANPLLKYDGYYVLSDFTEIPNLRQKASTILNRKLSLWCLGIEEPDDPFLPQRNQIFFALYTVGSAVYRWLILLGIVWFLYQIFEPYGLKVVSQTLAAISIISLIAQPIYRMGKFFYTPGRADKVERKNVQITLGLLTALVLFIVFCPLPYRVLATLELKPYGADPVYTEIPGVLQEIAVKPGQKVEAGDVLGQLRNVELELQIAELEGRLEMAMARESLLRTEQARQLSNSAGDNLPEVEEAVASLNEQLEKKRSDKRRLQLVAPSSGFVLPPPDMPSRTESESQLAKWTGTPLQKKNLGAFLSGVLFCQIGDPRKMEAILYIEHEDIEFVHAGQDVAIKLDEIPYRTYASQIEEVGPEQKTTPRQLSSKSGGELMSKSDASGRERPMNTTFQARCPLDDEGGKLVQGLRGTAKIHAQWQPLGTRLWRYLIRTFHFKL